MNTFFLVTVGPLKKGFLRSYRAGRIQDKSTFGKWNEDKVFADKGELYVKKVWSDEFAAAYGGSFVEPKGLETY